MIDGEISIHYDPMIAKLICWGKSREEAINHSIRALDEYYIGGVSTNISFLKFILQSEEFKSGSYNINSVEQKLLKEYDSMVNENLIQDYEIAAAILSAHLKRVSNKITNQSENTSTNRWREQLYE
jgi:acetyl/propionyl-CoA carboxylase alpha subunit